MGDIVDQFIKSYKWKFGSFNLLPIVFGLTMATLDIGMMSVSKITSKGELAYSTGLLLSTLIYAPQPYLFLKALKFENMTGVNLIWNLTSNLLVTLTGVFYFGESIAGMRWVAICMALFSLVLFAYTSS
ncbi:MAG: hypothetical protein EB127_03445 [Alphaproteobacteria bacterium]|nr:hypothetical protein [Alphaproteobacteria bacterium]